MKDNNGIELSQLERIIGCNKEGDLPKSCRTNKDDKYLPFCVSDNDCQYKIQRNDEEISKYCGYLIKIGYVMKEW